MLPLVAVTVFVNVPAADPAVNTPVTALIVPPPLVTVQIGMMLTTLPAASRPTAVNCCCVLAAIDTGVGVTVMVATTGAGGVATVVTMTVAKAERDPLVARIVFVNVPATEPAVKSPIGEMVPPPETTLQVGVAEIGAPAASVPSATNCWVPFTASVWGFGMTVSTVSTGPTGGTGPEGVAPPWTSQPDSTAILARMPSIPRRRTAGAEN